MIQRIQSLWMLCSAIIAGTVSFFCPLARLTVTEDFAQDLTGWSFLPLGVILMLVALITLFDIFLFRKRALQMRLMTFSIVLLVGWYLLSAVAGLAAVGATFYIQAAITQRIPDFMAHYGVAYYLLLIGGIALFILSVAGCVVKAMSKRAK